MVKIDGNGKRKGTITSKGIPMHFSFTYYIYIYLNSLKWQCQPSTPIGYVLADGVCHSSVNRAGNGKQVLRIKYANHQSLAWDVHDTIIFLE